MLYTVGAVIIATVAFIVISDRHKLYNIHYNADKKSHKALIVIITGLCLVMSSAVFIVLYKKSLVYPFIFDLRKYNAYEQLFDAFMKHRLSIDITPDSLFEMMENPYDWGERKEIGVSYLWDRALYNNQYFSYFGIAPLVLVYFPFYFITGKVPSAETVCFIFSIISIIAIAALCVKAAKLFAGKVNLWLLAFTVMAVEGGSLVLMVQSCADMYYIAVSSAITFLSLYLLFTLWAFDEKKVLKKCLLFFLSGLSLVFIVMSRPNIALFFIVMIPVYLSVIFNKDYTLSDKLKQVMSFAVPVIIGAAAVMWYNYMRFGSILEFGSRYQLTVHDVSEYSITSSLLLPSVFYYFFMLPGLTKTFPFISLRFANLKTVTQYLYVTSTFGVLSFPSALGVLTMPSSLKSKNKMTKAVFMLSVLSCVALAFADTCLGGVCVRYVADISLVFVLFTAIMLIDFYSHFDNSSLLLRKVLFFVISALLILTFLLGIALVFENERNNILNLLHEQINY